MNKLIIRLIKFYQKTAVSRPKRCKYHPTCSNYCLESFEKFDFFTAFTLSIWRIIRCNPIAKGGYDPVPPNSIEKLFKDDYK
ncbi:MAG: membrane protein insertion efficiency factor YidD [Bacilli bacterium]|nr:membrane protein insertion efficiency factor YidD [Bacilli bacterium]MDD4077293.1 membrane protein insertion efficiency factor YidD [Bacilli bacterium]MDD4388220.1 membrane protein insertion efficiency factor YidD [Bacilli bacterium]